MSVIDNTLGYGDTPRTPEVDASPFIADDAVPAKAPVVIGEDGVSVAVATTTDSGALVVGVALHSADAGTVVRVARGGVVDGVPVEIGVSRGDLLGPSGSTDGTLDTASGTGVDEVVAVAVTDRASDGTATVFVLR